MVNLTGLLIVNLNFF